MTVSGLMLLRPIFVNLQSFDAFADPAGWFSSSFPERIGGQIEDGGFLTACSGYFVREIPLVILA